jgi:hypothetical protein
MGFLASLWGLRFAIMSKIRFQTSVYQSFSLYIIHISDSCIANE